LARLKIDDADASGYVHFPDFLDEEFFLQLTSERLVKRRLLRSPPILVLYLLLSSL
jgi:phage terminase large subunit GpA-like protein